MKYSLTRLVIAGLLLLGFTSVSLGQPNVPQQQGTMLTDFSGKLSPDARGRLESLLNNFRNRSGIEIAVVATPFDALQGYPLEDYALELGRKWGVGHDSDKRAMLLLVAIKPPDEQGAYHGNTRLEVSRRLEGDVPDGLAGELIRNMHDDFQAGRFDQAFTSGTQTIVATLADRLHISMDGIDQSKAMRQPVRRSSPPRRGGGISIFTIIFLVFIFLAIIRAIGGGRGGGGGGWWILPFFWGGGGWGGGSGWGGDSNDSGWGGGGGDSGWGGGGGGGDFGGFGGGGDFGGGGASDSW